ncbi:MAG: hypothetical protein ABI766_09495 [Gemmatimonadales bacterium]
MRRSPHPGRRPALTLAPRNLDFILYRAMVALAQGDLAVARQLVRAALTAGDSAAVLAYFGNYQDLYWAIVRAETYRLRGDTALPAGAAG